MNKGFSLVEILVVIAVVGIVLALGLQSLTATIRSSTKTTIYNQVKQSGDLAMETMVRSVRNAIDVCTATTAAGPGQTHSIFIYGNRVGSCSPLPGGELVRYFCIEAADDTNPDPTLRNGFIRKIDATSGTADVVSQVRVDVCNFAHSDTTPRRVTFDLTLGERVDLPQTSEFHVSIPFHSEVTLRNF